MLAGDIRWKVEGFTAKIRSKIDLRSAIRSQESVLESRVSWFRRNFSTFFFSEEVGVRSIHEADLLKLSVCVDDRKWMKLVVV